MQMNSVLLKIDGERVVDSLRRVLAKLDGAAGENVLDFSAVTRIDASSLQVLEEVAGKADANTKVVLLGVNPVVYKALKLMKVDSRFSYLN
jgi:anti-anti-sigma regulatory factor